MKKTALLSVLCAVPFLGMTQQKLESFKLENVRLLDGPFKQAEQTDIDYILAMDPDRLLAPFLREAGLETKAPYYPNWESDGAGGGLCGHIGGHYLSALAMMYASTGDERMKERLDYMVSELKRAQKKNGNGYLGGIPNGQAMWKEIKNGNIRASGFGLNDRWVPLYNIHKIYGGLRDAYLFGGNNDAKAMLIDLSDWMLDIVKDLRNDQIQDMLRSEHGGMNEVFADVAEITGNKKYLELARRFSQRSILDPLVRHEDKLTGMHANTQIPKVIGYKRIADLDGNDSWSDAAEFFWNNVTSKRSITIGGNSVREHFHPIDNYSSMIESEQGPETCNTYNMLKLTKLLFLSNPEDRYIEFFERALYNHILSTQDPEHGGFVYFTPMRPGHYRVYSQPDTCFWCCVGSGLENHAKYGDLIYAHSQDELYVNLFIPSVVQWKEKGVTLIQQTDFPNSTKVSFTLGSANPAPFTLKLRYPAWSEGVRVSLNGQEIKMGNQLPGSYIEISRKWKKGDKVEMELPMHLEAESIPDHSHYYSFRYGPIVLAAKTGTDNMPGLFANDSRGGHIANGPQLPLTETPILVGEPELLVNQIKPVEGKPLTFSMADLLPKNKNLELIPFFRLHEARYIVYWRQATEASMKALQEQMAKDEAERQQLAERTIDMVYPGEQQPESDHFFEQQNSQAGTHKNKHWRDARGWFSYILKDKNREAQKLRILYFGLDRDRNFSIHVNGQSIASVRLNGSHGDAFFAEEYAIPKSIMDSANGVFTVKFVADSGSVAGGIYEVRLVK